MRSFSYKAKQNFVVAIWLPMLLCLLSITQILAATHLHDGNLDTAPEASCSICIQAGQYDDTDLPTALTTSNEHASQAWALLASKQPAVVQTFGAKARAPPYS
ncbi:MAG: hypothetical protein ABJN65_00815 [Parasphingorhabdus sp.]